MSKKKDAFKGTTHIGFVLDESNSMARLKDVTLGGYNEWLHAQKKLPGSCRLTLTIFDTRFRNAVNSTPIADVQLLRDTEYLPHQGGMTALYDAIGLCVRDIDSKISEGDRALIVILTDGQENQSKEFTRDSIRELVESHEKLGNWTFTYLSASPSAFADAKSIGTQDGNVAVFAATPQGMTQAMRSVSTSTENYRGGVVGQSASFYSDPDDAGDAVTVPNDGARKPKIKPVKVKTP